MMRYGLVLILLLVLGIPVAAQSEVPSIVVTQFPEDAPIRFLALGADGSVTQLGELPIGAYQPFFAPTISSGRDAQTIWTPDNIVVSPDRQYVAVSAGQSGTYQLDVYRMTGELLWSAATLTSVKPVWSPDATGFVFFTDRSNSGNSSERIGIHYFSLERLQTSILHIDADLIQLEWIADRRIAYRDTQAIYTLTLDGEVDQIFDIELYPELFNVAQMAWSPARQLFYVVLDYPNDSPYLQTLYTVDLEGNAIKILGVPEAYFGTNVVQGAYSIRGIEDAGGSVYVLLGEYLLLDDPTSDVYPAVYSVNVDRRRVLRWNAAEREEVILLPEREGFRYSTLRISPNGQYLAVGQYEGFVDEINPSNQLLVIDLTSGQIVRRVDTTATYSDSLVWFNHYQFLYSDSFYGNAYPMMSPLAQIVDLSRLPAEGFIIPLTDPIWLDIETF